MSRAAKQLPLFSPEPSKSEPPQSTFPNDPWLASSALQKAIRRGDADTASAAIATLHRLRGSSVWSRMLVIAFEDSLAVATLVRRLASISKAHRVAGLATPAAAEIVRATLRGIKRARGTAQRQAAPLLRDDLGLVVDRMDDSMKAARDRALLLIGFAGALRRAELVALNVDDLDRVKQGIVLHLRRSKTDQEGRGETIGIPFGRTRWCPVTALDNWLSRAGIRGGPIFRPVDRHGHIQEARLSAEAVSCVIKERVAAAGFEPAGYSGHSLRSGFATSAAQAGIATWIIRRQTRHASDAMLARYVRSGELFTDNAAGALL